MDLQESLDFFRLESIRHAGELKKRYRELIKKYHPDRHPHDYARATKLMQDLNTAYDILNKSLTMSSAISPVADWAALWEKGDDCLREAVLRGWLFRTPKHAAARSLRAELSEIARLLAAAAALAERIREQRQDFFRTLFAVFLRATDTRLPRPFLSAGYATRFFRNLELANRTLDKGIRYFYHYAAWKGREKYAGVAVSALEDAYSLYALLLPLSGDRANRRMIQARMELSQLFRYRLMEMEACTA